RGLGGADLDVERVHDRGVNLHQEVAAGGDGLRHLLDDERPLVAMDPRGLHAAACGWGRSTIHEATPSSAVTAPQAMNSVRMPRCSARTPESSIPSAWASEKSDMKVLDTRPCIAGGVSRCDRVCAGTTTHAMPAPMSSVLTAAVALNWTAPSRTAPEASPPSPATMIVPIGLFLALFCTTAVPAIRPTPTIALIAPYIIGPAPSESRTYTEISGLNELSMNIAAAVARNAN